MAEKTATFFAETRIDGETAVIDLQGEINGLADNAIDVAYVVAEQASPQKLILNFTNVSYINSTGIALIVGILARARAIHLPVVSTGLSEHYREIFTITRLSDFMEIRP